MHRYKKEKMSLKRYLISDLKSKKELSSLDGDFLSDLADNYFVKNKKLFSIIEEHPKFEKSREYKITLKDLRKILHEIYGVFQLDHNREKLLGLLEKEIINKDKIDDEVLDLHKKILKTHRSTKERLDDYRNIYKKILDKDVRFILDIGSGLNVFSFPFMGLKKVDYIAAELNAKDCLFLDRYFDLMKKFGLNGKSIKINLLKDRRFPEVDVVFLFKVLDTLESLERGITKEILDSIKCRKLVVSFPTNTLSGKNLSKKRLIWFEKLIKNYETFETGNEIFYIIKEKDF